MFNLSKLLEDHREDVRSIRNVVEKSDLPYIDTFSIVDDPYEMYPEFDSMKLEAILLYPTIPDLNAIEGFLNHGILLLPIGFVQFMNDQERNRYRSGAQKVAYQTIIRMYFSITESIVLKILKVNPSIFMIGIDEFGRVLLSKYIRHPREFILNHSRVARSFSERHLELIVEQIRMHKPKKIEKSIEAPSNPKFDLPQIHKEFYIDLVDG